MGPRLRIEDLAEPELSDDQRGALEFGEQATVDLTVDAVLGAAVDRTGLDDFGPESVGSTGFRERLALWLDEVDRDPERTGLGRLILFNDCVRYAANRLRIHDLLARHPEIHDQRIERPIIVVGLPRSGTTHLVNLIAADQRLRSLPLWESYEPVPVPGEVENARWQRCADAWAGMQQTVPLLAAMHPMAPDHVHEELELQLPDFTSYELEWVARVPRWRDHYLATDQTPHYEYLRTVLKILQWYRPGERWVLKSPQHLEQMGPLLATFPDATIVWTHRDPVSVVQSAATMLAYGARMSYRATRPEWYLAYWTDRIRRLLDASVRDRHLVADERSIDVLFHEFMADDVATVERIYEVAGLPMTAEARAQIQGHLAGHERGKDGQVVYDLRQDFGTDPADVRARFGVYLDRIPVREEVA